MYSTIKHLLGCWSWFPNTEEKLLSVTKLLFAGGAAAKPKKWKMEENENQKKKKSSNQA